MRIRFGIPNLVIDAVGNSGEAIRPRSQQPIEPMTLIARLNLAGIAWADGGKRIGGDDSRLQSRRVSFEHKVIDVRTVAKTKPPQIACIEQPLIADVVKRKQAARSLKERIVTAARAKFSHRETRGPIVSVDDIGLPVEMLQQRKRGA